MSSSVIISIGNGSGRGLWYRGVLTGRRSLASTAFDNQTGAAAETQFNDARVSQSEVNISAL